MNLKIENCNNIFSGDIDVAENSLNIKYAVNGTGKSSVAKIIKAFSPLNEAEVKKLVPYNTELTPILTGLNEGEKVFVFNEDYVNRYLFQKDDIIPNAFNIFIKTEDYEERMAVIKEMLSDVRQQFENNQELDDLIAILSDFLTSCGKASDISKAGAIFKGLGEGNKIDHIPEDLKEYAPYLQKQNDSTNVRWLKWMVDGKPFVSIAEQCPFCSTPGNAPETKTSRVYETYDAKKIEHLNKILEIFEKLEPYLCSGVKDKINAIKQNVSGITKEDKALLKCVKNEASEIRESLLRVKNFDFFTLKDVGRLKVFLQDAKINLKEDSNISSQKMIDNLNAINESIADVEEKVDDLQREIGIQRTMVYQAIQNHKKKKNAFLECAGYNYDVDIDVKDEENARLLLLPKGHSEATPINDVKDHLSYGERNAFALILYVYSALSENTTLFVFDDPISSFDGNKRFAIINMLFLDETPLRNKTILLLTHDFSIVVDVMLSLARRFSDIVHPRAHFLTNHGGLLEEKEITRDDIHTFCSIMKENAQKEIHPINRAIYLRRYFEINDEKGCVWDVLSCLFHKRERSSVCRKVLPSGEEVLLTDEEFNSACEKIKESIPDFNYDVLFAVITDNAQMKEIYRNAESNYEKLQIYRIIKGENAHYQDNVVRKFVNETFHVDNDYIYQLNPREFETVPQYIIEICDREILGGE